MSDAAHDPLRAADPARNATVAASAGTGKTWLLVTRMIRLLLAGADPDRLLAVTFTRKAAAEMHTRLAERLYDLAAADEATLDAGLREMGVEPADEETRARARSLYEALLFAERPLRISTFHAFCQSLLRKFALEADVPAGFELIETTGALEAAAWDALFAEATRAPDGETARALDTLFEATGGVDSTRNALMDFLARRSDWWAYVERLDDPLAYAAERLREALAIDPDAGESALLTDEEAGLLGEFAELLERHPTKTNQEHAALLRRCLDVDRSPDERLALAWTAFFTGDNEPRKRKEAGAQKNKMGGGGEARFLELHAFFCEHLNEVRDRIARPRTLRVSTAWFRAGDAMLGHFQRLKREQRLLDFADLEWRAYRLLNQADQAQWVQYKLDQRIDHLLVDEFQDTNPTQWRLVLPLLEELAAGEPERSRSVFLVGDAKQSIYRFRRAEPRLMTSASEWLAERLAASGYTQARSRRSAPPVVDFVNTLFEDGPLGERLAGFERHGTHRGDLWGRVELMPLVRKGENDDAGEPDGLRNPLESPRPEHENRRHLEEGRMVADRIKGLVEARAAIAHRDGTRPATYDDVVILLRKRTHARAYEQALRETGIPFVGADRGTLLESLEVDDLVKLLTVLITPEDDLALAQVLRAPLFAAGDDDLAALARAGHGAWWARLMHAGPEQPANAPLERAARRLGHWAALAGRIPVHDLLDRIFSEGEVMDRYEAAYPEALRPRVRANLTRFIELALEIDAGRYPSLSRFLTKLEQLRTAAQDAPDEGPAPSDRPRVRIMTIHAAKGLEAPVVFLADAASGGGRDQGWRALVQWPPGDARPDAFWLAAKKAERDSVTARRLEDEGEAQAREETNLLYVAATRAIHALYISASEPSRKDKEEPLGWYGRIAERVGYDWENETDAWVLGDQPPTTSTEAPEREPEPIEIDPRLTQPIEPPAVYREITPSRAVTVPETGGARGKPDEDARLRGIAIHRLLALIAPPDPIEPEAALRQTAAELGLEPDDRNLREWLDEAVRVVRAPDLAHLFDPDLTAYKEVPVCYEQDRGVVYGVIDRVVLRDGSADVVDYKSHRLASAEDAVEIAALYAEQMRRYTESLTAIWNFDKISPRIVFTHNASVHHLTP